MTPTAKRNPLPPQTLSTKAFRRISVPSDGDCFYHSLHECLKLAHLPAPPVSEIRRRVARQLTSSATTAAERRAAGRAAHTGSWAENEEVAAAAREFGVYIRVWEGHNRMWVTFGSPSGNPSGGRSQGGDQGWSKKQARPKLLLYMHNPHNVHFEPIVPMQ